MPRASLARPGGEGRCMGEHGLVLGRTVGEELVSQRGGHVDMARPGFGLCVADVDDAVREVDVLPV